MDPIHDRESLESSPMKVMPSFLPMFYDTLRSSSQIHFSYAHSELFGNDFEKEQQTKDTYEVELVHSLDPIAEGGGANIYPSI